MRNKLAATVFTLTILSGCASVGPYKYKAEYQQGLKKVLVNNKPVEVDQSVPLAFKDDLIKIAFQPLRSSVQFLIENNTDDTIKIIWDECLIVHEGQPMKVYHAGVKFANAGLSHPPSLILPKGRLKELAAPVNLLERYRSGWSKTPMVEDRYQKAREDNLEKFKAHVAAFDKKDIYDLVLTIETATGKRQYLFDFEFSSAKVTEM